MTTGIGIQGIDLIYILMGMAGAILFLFLLIIVLLVKNSKLKKKYQMFMKGQDGKSLEDEMRSKFEIVDALDEKNKELAHRISKVKLHGEKCFSKMELLKYNAFKDMGGETSFVISLLDNHNDGILLNAMSNRSGSYLYSKDIKNGTCEFALSEEERETLEKCMNQN